ncbi:MAG: ABC transporter permease subunit [Acidobacteria bacterium]|nr:ABC transporter permease subunit [Acidobacteriota bacterium]
MLHLFVKLKFGPVDLTDRGPAILWWMTATSLADLAPVAMVLAAFSFGAAGIGEEFHRGTIQFLLARPRRRLHFVWTGWIVGAAELALLVSVAYGISRRFGSQTVFGNFTWRQIHGISSPEAAAWKSILLIFIVALLLYSLAYFTTLLMRGGRNGFNLAVGILIVYCAVWDLLHFVWHMEFPFIFTMFEWTFRSTGPDSFPVSAFTYLLVAMIFPFASQWLLERAEV